MKIRFFTKFSAGKGWLISSILLLNLLLISSQSFADYPVDKRPQTVTQPDGTKLHLFVSGDSYYHWLHDADNYTIVLDKRGYFVYAKVVDGELAPTEYVVGKVNPATTGLRPGLNHSEEYIARLRDDRGANIIRPSFLGAMRETHEATSNARFGGTTMNPLVIFVRFKGEAEFTQKKADYTGPFNTDAISLKKYYQWNSYNTLTINSTIVGGASTSIVSYQDAQTRAYYQVRTEANPIGYDVNDKDVTSSGNRDYREQRLWQNAIKAMKAKVPATLDLDGNSDGYIDMIYFVVSNSQNGWAELLWPHMGGVGTNSIKINGKIPNSFMCVFEDWHDVGLLCHETGHVLGAPDFYRYAYNDNVPVEHWDLMSNQTNPPQSMSAYTKWKYMGFISSIPEITKSGYYTLSPLADGENAYKIRSTKANEFFVVEYRKKTSSSYESAIHGSGLLIYRINTTAWGNGNSGKKRPDTLYIPDELFVYRPGGTNNSKVGDITKAPFSSDVGRTTFGDNTSPNSFMSDDQLGRLNISNISTAGNTISFYYEQTCMSASAINSVTYNKNTNIPNLTEAVQYISTSGDLNITSGQNKTFRAGKVILRKGFRVSKGANFYAVTSDCKYEIMPSAARMMASTEIQVSDDKQLEELSTNDGLFDLYPNPTTQFINVDFKDELEGLAYIEIFNASGIKIYHTPVDDIREKTIIDLKNQPTGLYFLRAISGEESSTKRFIIK
jgi:M6 family metalloprotease-like protein